MKKWIYNNIRYPDICVENGIGGKVTAKFTVNKFGNVTNIEIAKGVHPDLDAEVRRVLKKMPDFWPAMQSQQLVHVFMYWPVEFRLAYKSQKKGVPLEHLFFKLSFVTIVNLPEEG